MLRFWNGDKEKKLITPAKKWVQQKDPKTGRSMHVPVAPAEAKPQAQTLGDTAKMPSIPKRAPTATDSATATKEDSGSTPKVDTDLPPSSEEKKDIPVPELNADMKAFLEKIDRDIKSFDAAFDEWNERKIQLMGDCLPEVLKKLVALDDKIDDVVDITTGIFSRIKEAAIESIEPAYMEIHDLLINIIPHFNSLNVKVEKLCTELNNPQLSAVDKGVKCIQLCHRSLSLLLQLKAYYEGIKAEIEYCLKAEDYSEKALNLLVNVASLLLVHRTLDSFGISLHFQDYYAKMLNNSIDKKEINFYTVQVRGHLQLAKNNINAHAGELKSKDSQDSLLSKAGVFSRKPEQSSGAPSTPAPTTPAP